MKRLIMIIFVSIICFLLQSTIFQYFALAETVPNLLLIVVVTFGYVQGEKTGLFTGLFVGFFVDCLYGNIIGLYALCYMIVGYLTGFCHRVYDKEDYVVPVCLVGAGDFIYNFLVYIIEFLFRRRFDFFVYFKIVILPEMIYTALVSIFLYKLLHSLNCFLTHLEHEEA